jgi:hypothetical protein
MFGYSGSSWLNLVERFFRRCHAGGDSQWELQRVRQLVDAIDEYLALGNEQPSATNSGPKARRS